MKTGLVNFRIAPTMDSESVIVRRAAKDWMCWGGHDGTQRTKCRFGQISKGQVYVEYIGEVPAFTSGARYHPECAAEQGLLERITPTAPKPCSEVDHHFLSLSDNKFCPRCGLSMAKFRADKAAKPTPHAYTCGRSGNGSCEASCICWCHKGCRLDVEIGAGNWQTLKAFDNLRQAETLARDLENAGIPAMVSCACGSYAFGECELCADEGYACSFCPERFTELPLLMAHNKTSHEGKRLE